MTEIKNYIEGVARLLPMVKALSITDAEKRAGEFLVAMAKITEFRHLLTSEKIKLLTVQTATYAEQMSMGTASTVTQNKLVAEASVEYTAARENLESIENDLSYLKAYAEIFQNAHIMYRKISQAGDYLG